MSFPRGLCRFKMPAVSMGGSYNLSLALSGCGFRILPTGCTQRTIPSLNSATSPLLPPPAFPSFQKSVLIRGLEMSKLGALGSASFSSSASVVAEDVLEFWFKDVGPEAGVYIKKEWFAGGPEFDAKCENNFGECLKLASSGALSRWMTTARGRLALVILLDQVSRNVYRDSASSYAQDPTAIKITLDTIEKGWDKELTPWERWFLYMPLLHSENMKDHEIADRLYEDMANENSDNEKLHEALVSALEFERKHSAVVKRFGRYPSRNAALGRPSTKEEEEFLGGGSGW